MKTKGRNYEEIAYEGETSLWEEKTICGQKGKQRPKENYAWTGWMGVGALSQKAVFHSKKDQVDVKRWWVIPSAQKDQQ